MGPDLRIDWSEVCSNPNDFEKLVKLLLVRLFPDGEVIDGRGGDGGREFQVRTDGSVVFYEAKSFTGRVSVDKPKRRAQAERSLKSAAKQRPTKWNLVVPVDHNESELKWFDKLRTEQFPFIDVWHGQTWLETHLAEHDDLVRYATRNKLLEYVRQYNLETAALSRGTLDLIARYEALDKLAGEVSPDWLPVVGRLPDGTRVTELRAKHPDAAKTAPITFTVRTMIPDDPSTNQLRRELADSRDFGSTVDIPGAFLSEFTSSGPVELALPDSTSEIERLVLGEVAETADLPDQSIAIYEPNAALPAASLRFRAEKRTRGSVGVRITAYDSARTVQLRTDVRYDQSVTFRLQAQPSNPILPNAASPGLRLAHALHHPNTFTLSLRLGEATAHHREQIPATNSAELPPSELLTFVQDLAYAQEHLRQLFPLPEQFTTDDVDRLGRLRRLIDGETVDWMQAKMTVTIESTKLRQFKAQFNPAGTAIRISWQDREVAIADEVLHTGPIYITGVVAVDLASIPDDSDVDVDTTFELVGDTWFRATLGVPPDAMNDTPSARESAPGDLQIGKVSYLASPLGCQALPGGLPVVIDDGD